VSSLENDYFIYCLAYLDDIVQQLNKVNLKLQIQGKGMTIFDFIDTLSMFVEKLDNWKEKAQSGNFAMFKMVPRQLVMK